MSASAQEVITVALFTIMVVTDCIGNFLVIWIILTKNNMQSPMNYLLANLAVADIMVGGSIASQFIISYLYTHPTGLAGSYFCKFFTRGAITWVGGAASVFSLAAISFDRYFAVLYPYSQTFKLNLKKVKRITCFCWIFTLVLNIPLFLILYYDEKNSQCMEKWPKRPSWFSKAYSIVWFVAAGCIPLVIMFYLYSRVIYRLWFKRSNHVPQVPGTQQAVMKARKRVTKIVITVSVLYGMTWMPSLTIYVLDRYDIVYNIGAKAFTINSLLVTFNSSINPFVYAFQSEKFRRHLKAFICCPRIIINQVDVGNEGQLQGTPQQS
ncbi:substance-P receptor-like [Actinia tenebrosa]|uniref:Substance-P receptor-like n=1 Tax=Actinia tenebrosa TaxID=6105 RepID=A0A6P8J7Z6_ACTTE|nr:substance-P receptor-like [Actinia tenebrosa]